MLINNIQLCEDTDSVIMPLLFLKPDRGSLLGAMLLTPRIVDFTLVFQFMVGLVIPDAAFAHNNISSNLKRCCAS